MINWKFLMKLTLAFPHHAISQSAQGKHHIRVYWFEFYLMKYAQRNVYQVHSSDICGVFFPTKVIRFVRICMVLFWQIHRTKWQHNVSFFFQNTENNNTSWDRPQSLHLRSTSAKISRIIQYIENNTILYKSARDYYDWIISSYEIEAQKIIIE